MVISCCNSVAWVEIRSAAIRPSASRSRDCAAREFAREAELAIDHLEPSFKLGALAAEQRCTGGKAGLPRRERKRIASSQAIAISATGTDHCTIQPAHAGRRRSGDDLGH